MKPMHFAMALLSAAMFFVLAGVFMGVQLGLDGTKLVVDTAPDIRWQWVFIGTAVVFLFQLLRPLFQKTLKNVSGPKFVLPAIDGTTVKQKLFLVALLVAAVAWPFMVSRGTVDIATLTMIYVILGLGLNVVVGLSGLLVLGYGDRRRGWRCLFLASWLNPQSGDDVLRRLTRTALAGYRPPGINMVKDESVLLIKLKNSWRC
mgnify:CR=1 FL=1